MSLGKKDIVKNIKSKAHFSLDQSNLVFNSFISFIKRNKDNTIKVSNFGVFFPHISPSRIGRNPKTKEEFEIPSFKKLSFRTSSKCKKHFN